MSRARTVWTADEIQKVRTWLEEDLTRQEIAIRLGSGRTREAVCGLIHRLGLPTPPRRIRPPTVRPARQATTKRSRSTRKQAQPHQAGLAAIVEASQPVPVEMPAVPACRPVPLVELANDRCVWPVSGEGRALLCCGASRDSGSSYCQQHRVLSLDQRIKGQLAHAK